MTVVMLEWD